MGCLNMLCLPVSMLQYLPYSYEQLPYSDEAPQLLKRAIERTVKSVLRSYNLCRQGLISFTCNTAGLVPEHQTEPKPLKFATAKSESELNHNFYRASNLNRRKADKN